LNSRQSSLFSRMGVLNKAADVVQKASVVGLLSLFGYQVYQIGNKVTDHSKTRKTEPKNDHLEIMKKIGETIEDESKFKNSIDKIPDRYDADDDSYLKKVPKL
jgi:hypothetical protein